MPQITDILISLFPIVLTLGSIGLIIWALIDLYNRPNSHKITWLILILFAPTLGAIAYLVINSDKNK